MALQCPACEQPALTVTASRELGPDERSDERSLQVVRCGVCGFGAIAFYEESRRGAGESFHHDGYYAPAEVVDALEKALAGGGVDDQEGILYDAGGAWYSSFPIRFLPD